MIETYDTASHLIISVMGPHAGESCESIFHRKLDDISKAGCTIWLVHSWKAKVDIVQDLCKQEENTYVVFIESSTKNGSMPTQNNTRANYISDNKVDWIHIPSDLSQVTGKLDNTTAGLLFDEMKMCRQNPNNKANYSVQDSFVAPSDVIDLWDYSDFSDQDKPVKFGQGFSTICAVKKNTRCHPQRMNSHIRQIIAVAHLTEPYAVWLRSCKT